MSLIKAILHQLGLSVTPANNFTLTAAADNGTMKLARGNAGATTQDIMTVDAAGKVAFPQNTTPVVHAARAAGGSLSLDGTDTISSFVLNAGLSNGFTLGGSGSQFIPDVEGWYQVNASINISSGGGMVYLQASLNGSNGSMGVVQRVTVAPYASGTACETSLSALIYCNGTGQAFTLTGRVNNGGTIGVCRMQAALVKRGLQ